MKKFFIRLFCKHEWIYAKDFSTRKCPKCYLGSTFMQNDWDGSWWYNWYWI